MWAHFENTVHPQVLKHPLPGVFSTTWTGIRFSWKLLESILKELLGIWNFHFCFPCSDTLSLDRQTATAEIFDYAKCLHAFVPYFVYAIEFERILTC